MTRKRANEPKNRRKICIKFNKNTHKKALTYVVNKGIIMVIKKFVNSEVFMADKMIKLPESELEIMQAIWVLNEEGEKNITASLIVKRFPALSRLKLTTILTLITRLQVKGFITVEKVGRSNCYTPIIPSDKYRKFASGDFVKKVYLDDKVGLISALVSDESLTPEELAEIKAIIEKN